MTFIACPGSCATCTGPSNCLSCVTNYAIVNSQCVLYPCSAGQYLHSNGLCITACDSPLVQKSVSGLAYCDLPCKVVEHLYSNGSCLATCGSPFVQKVSSGVNLCTFPCNNGEFLLPNGSCVTTCDWPNTQVQYRICECPRYTTNINGKCVPCALSGCSKCDNNVNFCDVCLDGCAACHLSDLSCTQCNDPTFIIYNRNCMRSCPPVTSPCDLMGNSGCNRCSCGYAKMNETTCYPVCKQIEMSTVVQTCENTSTTYQPPQCIEDLDLGVNNTACLISSGN